MAGKPANHTEKAPRVDPGIDIDHRREHPVWQVGIIDVDGPFGWNTITNAELQEVRTRLAAFESMTWHEIIGQDNHEVETYKLSKAAKDRLLEIKQDDTEQLFSLRISGPKRIWGILDRNALKVLWWDPEHKVYPVPKRNT